jgi:DNA replicative helicase MCM subunit Mcm2 (Cdc46/Mcm family)
MHKTSNSNALSRVAGTIQSSIKQILTTLTSHHYRYAGQQLEMLLCQEPRVLHATYVVLCPTQIIKVQEDPSNIPEGETPRSLLMYAFDTNVDACKPGDKVTVTGED